MLEILKIIPVIATIYHAEPTQTNADYWHTANMSVIDTINPGKHRWIAVSRNLEKEGFTLGKVVIVSEAGDMNGEWTIQDRMNKRYCDRIDFLVNKEMKYGKWNDAKIELK